VFFHSIALLLTRGGGDLTSLVSDIKAEACTNEDQMKQNHSQTDLSFSELLDAVLYLRARPQNVGLTNPLVSSNMATGK
jgi:hypothetical protein